MTRNLLLTGGPGHDFATTSGLLVDLLGERGIDTTVVDQPADALEQLSGDDPAATPVSLFTVLALRWRMEAPRFADRRQRWAYSLGPGDAAAIDAFVRRGGGLLALHTAVICFDAEPTWRALCGAAWSWERSSHPPAGPAPVSVTPVGRTHPITAEVDDFVIDDEVYGFLDEDDTIEPLLTSVHGDRPHPILWTREVGAGRVVTDLLGHGPASFTHPAHRSVLGRAAEWAVREPEPTTGDRRGA